MVSKDGPSAVKRLFGGIPTVYPISDTPKGGPRQQNPPKEGEYKTGGGMKQPRKNNSGNSNSNNNDNNNYDNRYCA